MLLRMVNLSIVAAIASPGHEARTSVLKPATVPYWRNLLRSIPISFELTDASSFNWVNYSIYNKSRLSLTDFHVPPKHFFIGS